VPGVVAVYWRWIVQLTAAMAILTLLLVGALNLEPYRYPSGVTAILPDTTCEPACVMGIQPGVTSAAEALALLEAHPMVDSIVQPDYAGEMMVAQWTWSAQVPALAQAEPSYLLYDFSGRVGAVRVNTQLAPALFWLTFGPPPVTYRNYFDEAQAHVVEAYQSEQMDVYYSVDCATGRLSGAAFLIRADLPLRNVVPLPTGYTVNRCRWVGP